MIVVTGSTGHVGRLVAEDLAARGEQIRLVVRDPSRAPKLAGAEVVQADYEEQDSLAQALHEGDRVFMVSVHEGPERRVPIHRSFIETAARRGVEQIVYLSFLNAGPAARFLHARSHSATESLLAESGVPYTSIRNGMYADDIPGWFDPDGVLREPGEDARITFSYRPDLAKAIAVTLTEPGHEGRCTTSRRLSVSLAELAEIATEATGRTYRYEPISDDEWDARWRAGAGPDGSSKPATARTTRCAPASSRFRLTTSESSPVPHS